MSEQPTTPPLQLEYGSPMERIDLPPVWTYAAFKVAIFCWAFPLSIGVATFFIWLASRNTWLYSIGYCVILLGTVMAVVGGISAIVLLCSRWPNSNRRLYDGSIAICLIALICSNFVVAFFLIMMVAKAANFHHGP